jgi:hypothetical protein
VDENVVAAHGKSSRKAYQRGFKNMGAQMSVFKEVDAASADKAKEVLAPFRDKQWHTVSNLEIVLTVQRADRLEQTIAEAIHEAANRQKSGNPSIPPAATGW